MSAILTRIAASLLMLAAPLALAQMTWDGNQALSDNVPSMDVVSNRLELKPEQREKLAPLFQQRIAEVQQARAKLEQASSNTEKNAVLREAKAAARAFNAQVESLLDTAQKAEWRELREETREKVKERYERKRESQ